MLNHILCENRINNLKYYATQSNDTLPGAVAEVGVYRGGSLETIALCSPKKLVYGFDTFEGLPKPIDEIDTRHHKQGDFSDTNYDDIKRYFAQHFGTRVSLVKGLFPISVKEEHKIPYSFVHLDVDLYESYVDCLNFFWPLLVPGGVIICDDYGWEGTPGAKKAIDDFFSIIEATRKEQLYPTIQYIAVK